MNTAASGDKPIIVSAFVGRSFLKQDEVVWLEMRKLLESFRPLGFAFEDAEKAEVRQVSEKVMRLIDAHPVYLAIITRRSRLGDGSGGAWSAFLAALRRLATKNVAGRWSPPTWVLEEIGHASAKGKRVIKLIEKGVDYPSADITADMEWAEFDRANVAAVAVKLNQFIANILTESPSSSTDGLSNKVVKPEASPEDKPAETKQTFKDKLDLIRSYVSTSDYDKANEVQATVLAEVEQSDHRSWIEAYILSERAIKGDRDALAKLQTMQAGALADAEHVVQLARYHGTLGQDKEAIAILEGAVDRVAPAEEQYIISKLLAALKTARDHQRAFDFILGRLRTPRDAEARELLLSHLADVAHDLGNDQVSCCAMESALRATPNDHRMRFDLAFRYSALSRPKLAAYHYKILVGAVPDDYSAQNNLAVECAALNWPILEIRYLKAASDHNPLAKANLAWAYLERGFLQEANELAFSIRQADQVATNRAKTALAEIAAAPSRETDEAALLGETTTEEREFRREFGSQLGKKLDHAKDSGFYATKFGKIHLLIVNGMFSGIDAQDISGTSLASLSLLGGGPGGRQRSLMIRGELYGRAGSFELSIRIGVPETLHLQIPSVTKKGLLFFRDDGNLVLFDEDATKDAVSVATRTTDSPTV